MLDSFKYWIVILDKSAISFCYYENKNPHTQTSELIPLNSLEQVIEKARKNDISINFLYGENPLPNDYNTLIESINHVKILPVEQIENYEGIYVVDKTNFHLLEEAGKENNKNIILRIEKNNLKDLSGILNKALGKFCRLNLILTDIEDYTEKDYDEYASQLKKIEKLSDKVFINGQSTEINFISDRIVLNAMNNCDAGIKHLTIAPDLKIYLCPAFYYDNEDSIGDLANGIEIKNKHLLNLESSSLCRTCDAFHCKRCIYLNKKTTLEFNIPSKQQCVISHLERNTSRNILNYLGRNLMSSQNGNPIPEIDYLDPFEKIIKKSNNGQRPDFEELTIKGIKNDERISNKK